MLILATLIAVIIVGSLYLVVKPKPKPKVDSRGVALPKLKKVKVDKSKLAKIAISIGRYMKKKQKAFGIKFKAMTAFSQIAVNVGFNCNITFPKVFTNSLQKLEVVNLDLFPSLAPACYVEGFSYINSMVSMTMMPICCGFMLGLAMLGTSSFCAPKPKHSIKELRKKYQVPKELKGLFPTEDVNAFRRAFAEFDADYSGSVDDAELTELLRSTGREHDEAKVREMLKEVDVNQDSTVDFGEFIYLMHRSRHEVNDDSDQEQNEAQGSFAALAYEVEAKATLVRGQFVAYLFLLLTFCFLIGSSTAVFQYFKCHEFPEADGGTRRFLYKDYSLDCDSVRYKRYIPYALLMVLIFPIGIPGFYWVLLRKHKLVLSDEMAIAREASEDFPTIGHLLFLTEAYRAEHYYFEVTECVRRLLLGECVR